MQTAHPVETDSILIVDNEPIVLDVLKAALTQGGFAVSTSTRLAEGAALVQAQSFACAITDKALPDGTGLDLIRLIRRLQPDCACMMMTTYPNSEAILEALKLGAVDCVEKPLSHLGILQEKVKAAIERQRHLSALRSQVEALKAFKAAGEAAEQSEASLQRRVDSLNFRCQRALGVLREVKSGLESGNAATVKNLLTLVTSKLEELK